MPWMTRWPGRFPLFFESAAGARLVDVDGVEYVDLCLGDTGAMTGHALPQVTAAIAARAGRGITTMLPSADAVWVGEELARRFGLPSWQLAMSATDANRFVLRFARYLTGRPADRRHGLVLPRHRRRDPRRARRRPGRRPARCARARRSTSPRRPPSCRSTTSTRSTAGSRVGDVACLLMEPALTNIGIVLPDPGYLDGRPRDHPAARRAAGQRRDPHALRRTRRRHRRLGPGPRHRGGGQADRRRHPVRGVRHERRGGRAALRADARPRDRRRRCRRHPHRQRARPGRDPGDAVDLPARGGLRRRGPARRAVHRRRRRA